MHWNNEILNKGSLFAAIVIGTTGIVFLKIFFPEIDNWGAFYVVGWPVGVLIVYWLAMLAASDRAIYEIIGDNCYYLGFIFTLVSLAVTLYLLYPTGAVDSPDELPIQKVISGFGIALSSTIVGIALRILMLRMTPDIAQRDSEARLDLDLAVRDFRAHLRMSVDELKRYSVETAQVLAEQRNAALNAVTEGAEEHGLALESSTAALSGFSETMDKQFSEHRAILRKALDGIAETVSERHGAIQDALQRSADKHREVLESSAESLSRLGDRAVQAISDHQEEMQRLARTSRETHEQTGAVADMLRKELDEAKALIESMGSLNKGNRDLDTVFSGLIDRLEKIDSGIAQKLEPAVAQVSEGATAIAATLAESSGKLKAAADGFESAAERTMAADTQTGIAHAVERLEAANKTLAEAITKLDKLAVIQAKTSSGRRWFSGLGSRGR